MNRITFLLIAIIGLTSCQQKPKKYTVLLVAKSGHENQVKEIEATTDSIAYEQALIAFYGAKQASKNYNLADKYSYVDVKNEVGESLNVILGNKTIETIKKQLGQIPSIKEIQQEENRLPDL